MTRSGQVFISYCSRDVMQVRPIVELLIADDLDVWFAEYRVLAQGYESFSEDLDRNIEEAIRASQRSILFVSPHWMKSGHCLYERRLLADARRDKPEPILVDLHGKGLTDEHRGELDRVRHVKHVTGDDAATARSLLTILEPGREYGPPPALQADAGMRRFSVAGHRLALNLGQYRATRYRKVARGDRLPWAGKRIQLHGWFESCRLSLLLTLIRPLGMIGDAYAEAYTADADDREYYTFLRRQARSWHASEPNQEEGLHLVWYDGRPSLGMTFYKSATNHAAAENSWQRLYVLHYKDPASGLLGEAHLSFGIPAEDRRASFRRFCRIAPCLDAMAVSLRYHGYSQFQELIDWGRSYLGE